ncbi:putative outer membrane protein [Streptomyces pseudovenezuelae]|uniref:Outer membrane protein n=2 Tax=Streptomyces pseudovenezuelae TaxID=67350 RepID=A0ABT6LF45_9ACTN|nr:putative outer membrane protein [Streptomyces pseudovenezuelae]
MRFSRNATGTLFVGGALTLTLAALAYPSMLGVSTVTTSPDRVIANTQWGPLTESDRDFVVKVRAAGLWEYPVGQIGLKKGTNKGVLIASQHLIDGHSALDTTCRKIAPMLGITLPNLASPQQQGFVNTLNSDSGAKFDNDFANILRVTHGSIFNTVAKIRSTTKNSLVRALADQANNTVLDHITVMEKTGLVNFDTALFTQTTPPKLPKVDLTPPAPPAGQPEVVLTPPPNATSTPVDINGISGGAAAPSPTPTVG